MRRWTSSPELLAAEGAFDAAHDGLPKFFRGKTQEEQNLLSDHASAQRHALYAASDHIRLNGLHVNVKESLNQLLLQIRQEKPPPLRS